ncbi:hypothetical protein PR048_002589 [Dryococelus australis]|uniref:Glucosylceramidase n=1 Tax=Dryococelus australis TaxID=614101 RepID=A0ABQ9IKM2_9NEOP|nr:hypothetical protein PR048_002589 [Dryococelus australis]
MRMYYRNLLQTFPHACVMCRFVEAYAAEGLPVWALTGQNEPVLGAEEFVTFNSMTWTSHEQAAWISQHLGPSLRRAGHADIGVFVLDDQRPFMEEWAAVPPEYSPPTKANQVQSPGRVTPRIFARGNHNGGRCRWSAGFLGDLPFPPYLHSGAAPFSLQSPSSALKTAMLIAAEISALLDHTRDLLLLGIHCYCWSCMFGNSSVSQYVAGMAVHWYYDRTSDPDIISRVHQLYPDKLLFYTEACDVDGPVSMLLRCIVSTRNVISPILGGPDFRKWESCRTMSLVRGFRRGFPVFPTPSFRCRFIFTSITLIGSKGIDVKSRPNLFTHPYWDLLPLGSTSMPVTVAHLGRCQHAAAMLCGVCTLCVEYVKSPLLLEVDLKSSVHRARVSIVETPVRPLTSHTTAADNMKHKQNRVRGGVVVRLLAFHEGEPGSIPGCHLRIFACGNRAGRCHWSTGFLGVLPLHPPFHSNAAPYSPRFTLIDSQDLAVKSRLNLYSQTSDKDALYPPNAITAATARFIGVYFQLPLSYWFTTQQTVIMDPPPVEGVQGFNISSSYSSLNFMVLYTLKLTSCLHWLLQKFEFARFLTKRHVIRAHNCDAFINSPRVTKGVSYKVWSNDKRITKGRRLESRSWKSPTEILHAVDHRMCLEAMRRVMCERESAL